MKNFTRRFFVCLLLSVVGAPIFAQGIQPGAWAIGNPPIGTAVSSNCVSNGLAMDGGHDQTICGSKIN